MENFVVSARKYRPQTFDTVVGQKHITTTLKNAILHNQLAHAFLFCGPRGVGKTTCARILAKTINCENRTSEGEACDKCSSCESFKNGTSLNVHELDAASNNSVEDIRGLVEQVRFPPQAGKYKVYIVDEVHMLSSSAFNAFLKTLEEPPSYAIFILATTEKHKILPTILSRCQIFDFKRITNDDTVDHLLDIVTKENVVAEKAALQIIANKSEGCMRDSLSILDKIVSFTGGTITYQNTLEHLNILDEDYFFKVLAALLKNDVGEVLLLYNEINAKGFEGNTFLEGMSSFIRNLLVCKNEKAIALLDVVESLKPKYQQEAVHVSTSFLVAALNILNEAEIHFKAAGNKKLHVEMCLIKLCYLQQAIVLTLEENAVVKKKQIDVKYRYVGAPVLYKKTVPKLAEKAEGKLFIETEVVPKKATETAPAVNAAPKQTPVKSPAKTNATGLGTATKSSLLDTLRQKYKGYEIQEVEEAIPLNLVLLEEEIAKCVEILFSEGKISEAKSLQNATVSIKEENHFVLNTFSFASKGFIENERFLLLESMQKAFKNRSIQMTVLIDNTSMVVEKNMTNQEKYQHLLSLNPALEELKNLLNLKFY